MSGTVGSVAAPPTADREFEVLCDDTGPFLRRYNVNGVGTAVPTDTELDGVTDHPVAGTVRQCGGPPSRTVTPHGVADTDWDLSAHPGTQSVTVAVSAGSVSVTTAEGAMTVPAGATLTWSVDGDTVDSALSGALTIDGTAPAASWIVLWTTNP